MDESASQEQEWSFENKSKDDAKSNRTSKKSKLPLVSGALLVILVAIGIISGFCLLFGLNSKSERKEEKAESSQSDSDTDSSDDEAKVKTIISSIENKLKENFAVTVSENPRNNTYSFISNDEVRVSYPTANYSLGVETEVGDSAVEDEVVQILLDNKFKKTELGKSTLYINSYATVYVDEASDISCTVYSDSVYGVFCAKNDWVDVDYVNNLADAYKKKEGETLSMISTMREDAKNAENIKANKYGYQALNAQNDEGYLVFYKKKDDTAWIYLGGGNGVLNCSEYTEDAKKAFAGTDDVYGNECFDEKSSEIVELY